MSHVFKHNKLVAHRNFVKPGEVAPHPWLNTCYVTHDEQRNIIAPANSCAHRGYKFVTERKQLTPGQALKCDFHDWTYERNGALLSAPGFDKPPPCTQLPRHKLVDINGFFFDADTVQDAEDIAKFFEVPEVAKIWFDDYALYAESAITYNVNWKVFMEIYLDGYHVKPYHAGLGTYLNCNDMRWVFGKNWSIQFNELAPPGQDYDNALGHGSQTWKKVDHIVREMGWNENWGAMFGTIYPGLMIELYPFFFVISQLIPVGEHQVVNYVQHFASSDATQELKDIFAPAYAETADEDGVLQDNLEAGRTGWYPLDSFPNHDLFEAGIAHLNEWERRSLPVIES